MAILSASLAVMLSATADDQAATIAALLKRVEELERQVKQLQTGAPAAPVAAPAPAVNPPPTEADRLVAVEQQVKVIEQKDEAAAKAASEKAKTAPVVSLGPTGLSVRSADSNFVFRFRGYAQVDGRMFLGDSLGTDTFLMRRVRPIFEGTVYDRFDYRVMLDFGSGQSLTVNNNNMLQDAYVNARIFPWLQVRAGKDKEPVGLERLQSAANLTFVERAFPTALVPNRDVGFQLRGEAFQGALEYQTGVFNGAPDGGSNDFDTDSDKDFTWRVFTQPFKNSDNKLLRGFGVGVAGTIGNQFGPLRTISGPSQQRIFNYLSGTGATNSPLVSADGQHWRFTPQGWYYYGPFGLYWEWVTSDQEIARVAGNSTQMANANNRAWQVAASYFLTGEDNGWRPVSPRNNLNFSGDGWGAFEAAARVSQLNLDPSLFPVFANPLASVTEALEWSVGLNWYLNRNIKLTLDYSHVSFEGGEQNPSTLQDENLLFSRVQFGF